MRALSLKVSDILFLFAFICISAQCYIIIYIILFYFVFSIFLWFFITLIFNKDPFYPLSLIS